ncbi:AREL1_4 [Blepharisma stoltei]|uniref:HECT-type E3 ubiquitin transferase n=1 Tax=Blepharisma stoltei TaxID=1481888 RepID=A0AAU9JTJ7_9CILI|nr:unnamed protein product [Blepharisma stoltei]
MALNIQSSSLVCPRCRMEFPRNTEIRLFAEHLISCLRHSRGESQQYKVLNIQISKDLPYETKAKWLQNEFNKIRIPWQTESVKFTINREDFIQSSMAQVLFSPAEDLHKEFQISFEGENGMDAGGIFREWITLLMKDLFAEDLGLFVKAPSSITSYTFPNHFSDANISSYIFAGKLMGKALFENIPINCPLSQVIYKHIIGDKIELKDLNFLDSELYNSLLYMQNNNLEDEIYSNFEVEKNMNGKMVKILLKKRGDKIMINEENKEEYIKKRLKFETYGIMKEHLNLLLQGFYSVVPKPLVCHFTSEELELAMCGLPFIDIDDWQAYTEYRGEYTRNHQVIQWFWEVLENLSHEQLMNLLLFVTGSPRLPVEGFGSLRTMRGDMARFTIEPTPYNQSNIYPRSHTCFNRLDLPLYPSKKALKKSLKFVINNHAFGFGIE